MSRVRVRVCPTPTPHPSPTHAPPTTSNSRRRGKCRRRPRVARGVGEPSAGTGLVTGVWSREVEGPAPALLNDVYCSRGPVADLLASVGGALLHGPPGKEEEKEEEGRGTDQRYIFAAAEGRERVRGEERRRVRGAATLSRLPLRRAPRSPPPCVPRLASVMEASIRKEDGVTSPRRPRSVKRLRVVGRPTAGTTTFGGSASAGRRSGWAAAGGADRTAWRRNCRSR